MTPSTFGSVAHMLYADAQSLDFGRVVEELHSTLTRLGDTALSLQWTCESIVIFDLSAVRIVLVKTDHPEDGYSTCLTVSVEPAPNRSENDGSASYRETCLSVVAHLHRQYPAFDTIWDHSNESVVSDSAHRVVETLPPLTHAHDYPARNRTADATVSELIEPDEERELADEAMGFAPESAASPAPLWQEPETEVSIAPRKTGKAAISPYTAIRSARPNARLRAMNARARCRAIVAVPAPMVLSVATVEVEDAPAPTRETFDLEFGRVRSALNRIEDEPPSEKLSIPLRLTAHALNASLIMVWAPLGAAVMTYALVMGEDIRFSGRIAVLTGLFGAALNTPIGQYIAMI